MLISKAYAQNVEIAETVGATMPQAPDAGQAFMYNMGLVLVLVVLFYVLLIAPQQRRFKAHSEMLSGLKKGDKVVTGGGLIGKIEKVIDEKEVIVDLGNDLKVTALLSTLQGRNDPVKPANDTAPKAAKSKSDKKSK